MIKINKKAEPKPLTSYQVENIKFKQDAADIKERNANIKAEEFVSNTLDNYKEYTPDNQQKALNYYKETGLLPKEDGFGWFDGDPRIQFPTEAGGTQLNKQKENKVELNAEVIKRLKLLDDRMKEL